MRTGVDESARVVSVRALERLHLTGTGDYLIVVSAPVLDVRMGPGSESQPGQRRGQILWSGFSSNRRLLVSDAKLRPGPVRPYLPLRLESRREGDRYELAVTNATSTSQVAFQGTGLPKELAALLDRTRRDSLAHRRLRPAYVTISGAISQRPRNTRISAPLRVEGMLRFPSAPSAASGGMLAGRTVRFSFVLGDRQPLTRRVEVTGGGAPKLSLEARPDNVVRGLTPPGGAGTWSDAVARSAAGRRTARAADRDAHGAGPDRISSRASSRTRTSSAGTARSTSMRRPRRRVPSRGRRARPRAAAR